MICSSCGRQFDYAVMAHQTGGHAHIEDNIYVGDVLVHKANYDDPNVVASCPFCWTPLQISGGTN